MYPDYSFPKVSGERVWLTQCITINSNGVNCLVKAVMVGVPVAIESVWATIVERLSVQFQSDDGQGNTALFTFKAADITPEVVAKVTSSKKKLRNSPHVLLTVVNPNAIKLIGRKADLPTIAHTQLKARGVPYISAWDDFLMPEMGEWFKPLYTFNVSKDNEAIYFCDVPSKERCFELFLPYLTELKLIARKELSA